MAGKDIKRRLAAWETDWHGAHENRDDAGFEDLFDTVRKAELEDWAHGTGALGVRCSQTSKS